MTQVKARQGNRKQPTGVSRVSVKHKRPIPFGSGRGRSAAQWRVSDATGTSRDQYPKRRFATSTIIPLQDRVDNFRVAETISTRSVANLGTAMLSPIVTLGVHRGAE